MLTRSEPFGTIVTDAATFQLVRHNDRNETILCEMDKEAEALADIVVGSALFGTKLDAKGDQIHVDLGPDPRSA